MDGFLGVAAGVMIAASFFSLLNPAINQADNLGMTSWIIVSLGFACGGIFLILGDVIFNYFLERRNTNNIKSPSKK